ncbi:hypothetical protein N1851_006022 [Merluccius polli]|uniref:Ig-like domain-containing protein n=1 Tax=Merluccius polli TaxID=89951 RepID=A0AA47N689_MERPO|nr:hypothetical protein N1851_006022 [Merluccius polli]
MTFIAAKRYCGVAAEILSSSHCVRLQSGVRCFCESQGNPVPSLAWRLAGEAVNHSAHWPIMEFPIDHLGIISVISLNQSDEDPPTLVCLSNNSVGIDRMELNLAFSKGSVVMTLLCALFHVTLCRKKRGQLSDEADVGNSTELALAQGEQVEVVYANKAALDEGGEELHYVDVSFVMLDAPLAAYPRLDFIRGLNSKTPEYAQIRPRPIGSGDGEPQEEDVYAECVSTGQTGVREVMVEGSQTDMKDSGIFVLSATAVPPAVSRSGRLYCQVLLEAHVHCPAGAGPGPGVVDDGRDGPGLTEQIQSCVFGHLTTRLNFNTHILRSV